MGRGQGHASGTQLLFGSRKGKKAAVFRDELTREEWLVVAGNSKSTFLLDNMFDPDVEPEDRVEDDNPGLQGVQLTLAKKLDNPDAMSIYSGGSLVMPHTEQEITDLFSKLQVVTHWSMKNKPDNEDYDQFFAVAKDSIDEYGIEIGDVVTGDFTTEFSGGFRMKVEAKPLQERLAFVQEQMEACLEDDFMPVGFKLSPDPSTTIKDTFYAQIDALIK